MGALYLRKKEWLCVDFTRNVIRNNRFGPALPWSLCYHGEAILKGFLYLPQQIQRACVWHWLLYVRIQTFHNSGISTCNEQEILQIKLLENISFVPN